MLELSWNGKEPLQLQGGAQRAFLHDDDTVVMRAFAKSSSGDGNGDGYVVGFGDCSGQIIPAA
jgi:fumarylacetoacetase